MLTNYEEYAKARGKIADFLNCFFSDFRVVRKILDLITMWSMMSTIFPIKEIKNRQIYLQEILI